jgi:hypothetical protein
MMTGIEVVAAAALGWVYTKARRVGGRLDAEVDRVEDAGLQRLHNVIGNFLGETPALEQARQEAAEGRTEPSEQTRLLFVQAVAEQVRLDPAFGEQLRAAVEALQPAAPAPEPVVPVQDHSVRVENNNGGVVARDITTFTFSPHPPAPPQS